MIVFLILYVLLCLWKVEFAKEQYDYLAYENTLSIKGIFIILVFFSHFKSYVDLVSWSDQLLVFVVSLFGQAMVAMFLFYSGFGMMESVCKKGMDYVKSLPRKRILATLLRFDVAVVLFWVVCQICKEEVTLGHLLASLLAWDSLGNSNWYIFTILVLYGLTYLSFSLFQSSENKALLMTGCMVFILILFSSWFEIRPMHWYDTALCYVFGMAYSRFRKQIESLVHSRVIYLLVLTLLIYIWLWMKGKYLCAPFLQQSCSNLIFAACVVLATMKIRFKNPVLMWCGNNLFELYMLQRIPMILLGYAGVNQNVIVYFVCCVVITCLMVKPFKKGTDILLRFVRG